VQIREALVGLAPVAFPGVLLALAAPAVAAEPVQVLQ